MLTNPCSDDCLVSQMPQAVNDQAAWMTSIIVGFFSFYQLVGQTNDLGRELLALCLYDRVIDGIGETCENAADDANDNADYHSHISKQI